MDLFCRFHTCTSSHLRAVCSTREVSLVTETTALSCCRTLFMLAIHMPLRCMCDAIGGGWWSGVTYIQLAQLDNVAATDFAFTDCLSESLAMPLFQVHCQRCEGCSALTF